MNDEVLREFKFYMTEPETGGEYKCEWKVPDYYPDLEYELDYLLEQFKHFLSAVGYSEIQLSKIQYLEDDEWKYVLEKYEEWDNVKQNIYEIRTKNDGEI